MTNIEKLDFVLNIFYEHNGILSSKDLHKKIDGKIIEHDVRKIVNHLTELNYVKKILLPTENSSRISPPYTCEITYFGSLFFEKGGFNNENKTFKLNHNWKIAKTSAAVANAVIIILISIWAIIESKKEPETKKLEKEIEILKNKVEKMNFIKKDSLKVNTLK